LPGERERWSLRGEFASARRSRSGSLRVRWPSFGVRAGRRLGATTDGVADLIVMARAVVVKGEVLLEDGRHTGALPGHVLGGA
jgi:hypothetical protein